MFCSATAGAGPRHDAEHDPPDGQRQDPRRRRRARHRAALCPAQRSRTERTEIRLRARRMRRLHGADRRRRGALLRHPDRRLRRARHRDARRPRLARSSRSGAGGLHRGTGRAMRLLPQRHDHDHQGAAQCATLIRPRPRCCEALRYNLCRCGAHVEIMRAAMRRRAASPRRRIDDRARPAGQSRSSARIAVGRSPGRRRRGQPRSKPSSG